MGVAVTLLVSSGVTRAAPSRVESLTPPPALETVREKVGLSWWKATDRKT